MAQEAEYAVGDKVFFASAHMHKRLGERSYEIVDRYQDEYGDWWYSLDKRNYMGDSFFQSNAPKEK